MTDGRDPDELRRAMRAIEAAFLLGVPGTTEVWLIRHADCYEDMVDHVDPPLSAIGREQAAKLGERLQKVGYDALYSSPFRRARETAGAITDRFEVDDRLVEVDIDLMNRHVEVAEKPERVLERMNSAIADAVARHEGGRVLMVSHGVAILGVLSDVMRLEFGKLRLMPYYTSINVLRVLGDRRMVGALADVAHLDG